MGEVLGATGLGAGDLQAKVAVVVEVGGVSGDQLQVGVTNQAGGRATGLADGGGVEGEHEAITVIERSLADLASDADAGRIADIKLLTLVLALRARKPRLFEG